MSYKAVINEPSYLCHFNKNHDPKNGRFTFKKAWETIDTAVAKGYDAVEKVGRGLGKGTVTAVKSIKKSFDTPEQKSETEIPPMKQPTGEYTGPKPASDFKTTELDSDYKELKALNIPAQHDLAWLNDNDDASTKWPEDYVKAIDIGIKALNNTRYKNEFGEKITNSDRDWFVFEDQTIGYPEVAYLLYKGHSVDDVRNITKKVINLENANYEYIQQYYGTKDFMERLNDMPYETNALWNLSEYSSRGASGDTKYEEEVVKLINEKKASHSIDMSDDSLTHYNKNHSKANGQFTSGDGDGDGIIDDHHNQNKFLNKDGSLTKYAKSVSGLSSIDIKSRKDVNYKKAQKLISKDVRKVEFWSGSRSLESEAAEYFAEKKLEKDIERANKDKDFMDALRKGVEKYFDIEKDDWSKAYDYEDQLLDELKKKYPQHKDVISGITIGENVYSGNYKKWLKTDNAFSDILNNDFYYEQSDLDSVSLKSIDDIISAYDRELANTMIQKYGSYNVDSAWKEKVGLK